MSIRREIVHAKDYFKTSLKCAKMRVENSLFDLHRCLVQRIHVNAHFLIVLKLPLSLFVFEDDALCVNYVTFYK